LKKVIHMWKLPAAFVLGIGAAFAALGLYQSSVRGETAYTAARTPDGQPDFNGVWQAANTANWDIQDHSARQGPVIALGAAFSVPAGQGVVEGNEIPYQPWAAARKKENAEHWLARDPEIKCFMPGVPRATYMPYPFQITQSPSHIMIAYEFADSGRTIYMGAAPDNSIDSFMGHSVGRWEGDTLVVDVSHFTDQTWLDRAGNFHSEAMRVVERYTRISPDVLWYEATIEDPNVFTRPWKMAMPLYRRAEPHVQLLDYKCVEFAEEVMYGHLRRGAHPSPQSPVPSLQ
jgi:hypothetical protein